MQANQQLIVIYRQKFNNNQTCRVVNKHQFRNPPSPSLPIRLLTEDK